VLNVFRGSASRDALLSAQSVLEQGGVLCIMPEGGNWAHVLRPARPGTAFLAHRVQVPIVPVGFIGLEDIFHNFRLFHRAPIEMNIGRPFGPLGAEIDGRPSKEDYDEMGHIMMRQIAELIRPAQRGFYSDDPAIREAARGTEIWPWEEKREGEVEKFRSKAR
jgi:1-acyl-sn-glycerol-3-phosphate acyltransferase